MRLILHDSPKRKTVARVDRAPKKRKAEDVALTLGLENFLEDVTSKQRAIKSEAESLELILDVQSDLEDDTIFKADNSHLPLGAERCAYTPTSNYNVVYIPVNRLRQVYQTDEALNPTKVKENLEKMRDGIALDPVEIGYHYDVHDGHHRWAASKKAKYTHVPCKVVGTDPVKVREAVARYKEVWKAEQPFDLIKGFLNTGKLVKRRVMVKGKNGKVFYRMQWVDPNDKNPALEHPGKDESTYQHHEDGVKELEKRQSNRFPIVHHPTNTLKNTTRNYNTDKQAYDAAHKAYQRGEKLPPVKINDKGEILEHHHLVDLAKKLGLSHVPVLVMGNTQEKQKLEERLKEETLVPHQDETGKTVLAPAKTVAQGGGSVGDHPDVATFKNFTSKKYTKQHLMDEARKLGISWKETTEKGEILPDHNQIAWMRAYQAICEYIAGGNKFEIAHDEKEVDKRMKQDGWDGIQKHFLKLLEKHGSKQALMEWAKANGITWKEKDDPSINWMYAATAIKQELAKGKMVDGIRTRQKGAMDEANLTITDTIKQNISELGKKYGKSAVMARASLLGIQWDTKAKERELSPKETKDAQILWMRASHAISRYVAQGNSFTIGEDNYEDNGIDARVGDYGGAKLSNHQKVAVDVGKRNSQTFELKAKEWAMKAFEADGQAGDHNEAYDKFIKGARNANIMLHFDPNEMMAGNISLIDQLSSDGTMRNGWQAGKVEDKDAMEITERELYGYDFDEASHKDRPIYGVVDVLNQGLQSSPYGSLAFVLKDDVKKRSTGTHTDSANLEYETNGKLTRSLSDPHHLLVDRWRTKWGKPKNKDSKRARMMGAVMNGTKSRDDGDYFEAQVIGGVDLRKDVDHVLVPQSWNSDRAHAENHEKIKALSKLMGFGIKYE